MLLDNRSGVLLAAACFGLAVAVLAIGSYALIPGSAGVFVAGLFVGAGLACFVALMVWASVMRSGASWMQGELGESSTNEVLKAAAKRGIVDGWVDNIRAGSGDIDHLAFGRFGAVAVESKFKSRADVARLIANANEAASHARTAQAVLRSVDVDHPMPVQPVVVVWGGGAAGLPAEGETVAPVIAGDQLQDWLAALPDLGHDRSELREVVAKVEKFAETRSG